ncbi:MAG: hypothetical protein ABWY82_25650 [Tardiphaga sp.]
MTNRKPNWLKNKKVLEWEREPDGICVVTAYGWAFDPDQDHTQAGHVHIYPTAKQARDELKEIRPCICLRCTSHGKLA